MTERPKWWRTEDGAKQNRKNVARFRKKHPSTRKPGRPVAAHTEVKRLLPSVGTKHWVGDGSDRMYFEDEFEIPVRTKCSKCGVEQVFVYPFKCGKCEHEFSDRELLDERVIPLKSVTVGSLDGKSDVRQPK